MAGDLPQGRLREILLRCEAAWLGLSHAGYRHLVTPIVQGLYIHIYHWDNGKENGNYRDSTVQHCLISRNGIMGETAPS